MPEALAVIFVLVTAVSLFLVARHHPATRAPQTNAEKRNHLQQRLEWLEERLDMGRTERWDAATLNPLQSEYEDLQKQLKALG